MVNVEHRDGLHVTVPIDEVRDYVHRHRGVVRYRACPDCRGGRAPDPVCATCENLFVLPVTIPLP